MENPVVTKGFGFVVEADLSSEGYGQRGGDKLAKYGAVCGNLEEQGKRMTMQDKI